MRGRIGKSKSIGLLLLFTIIAFVSAGQTWFEIKMKPSDDFVVLREFDGFSTFSWISPLLWVSLAATLVTLLVSKVGRTISLSVALLSSLALVSMAALGIVSQDLSGVSRELEQATGIAANHGIIGGIAGLQISTTLAAFFGLTSFLLIGVIAGVALLDSQGWGPARLKPAAGARAPKETRPGDSISLWDQQR